MRTLAGTLLIALLACNLAAQQPKPPTVEMRDGGVSVAEFKKGKLAEVLESIYIPTIKNAPFSAIVHTEWVRYLPDGGSYALVNQRPIARDKDGRIFEERWFLVPPNGKIPSRRTTIQIGDPNLHTLYNCFEANTPHRCSLETFKANAQAIYKPAIAKTGPLPNDAGFSVHEDLGKEAIQGIEVFGTRDTITYNEGYFGNDRPATGKREFWYAPSLGINLRSEVVDPTYGKQTFTITDVSTAEPDPSFFEVPEGYEVVDRRDPQAPEGVSR